MISTTMRKATSCLRTSSVLRCTISFHRPPQAALRSVCDNKGLVRKWTSAASNQSIVSSALAGSSTLSQLPRLPRSHLNITVPSTRQYAPPRRSQSRNPFAAHKNWKMPFSGKTKHRFCAVKNSAVVQWIKAQVMKLIKGSVLPGLGALTMVLSGPAALRAVGFGPEGIEDGSLAANMLVAGVVGIPKNGKIALATVGGVTTFMFFQLPVIIIKRKINKRLKGL